ncbi:FG-GAP repeat domain-containing protein [Sulfitobacter sp. 1A13496]|uniref:FG-GAP repeat domain-containing protein n=1 Tax=Sulfitobacter sp. 1A13496 TaxID=3368596 RepID=UPI001445DDD7|nr:VCBS repeat-containing protein [Rhodobacteraceae bacterium R_SAG2]
MRAIGAALLALIATDAAAETITAAHYIAPTGRYAHGILGDALEWGGLQVSLTDGGARRFHLPRDHVFEDIAPRLVDVTGDGAPEVLVVETDVNRGAALAIYGPEGKITETPHIGQSNRWLAPIGAADLDGDGAVEIAYVDRPHLARVLRVWRFADGRLSEVAQMTGLTNHRIGERHISGGLRDCGAGPEIVLADADWQHVVGVRLTGGQLGRRDIGPFAGAESFAKALACE